MQFDITKEIEVVKQLIGHFNSKHVPNNPLINQFEQNKVNIRNINECFGTEFDSIDFFCEDKNLNYKVLDLIINGESEYAKHTIGRRYIKRAEHLKDRLNQVIQFASAVSVIFESTPVVETKRSPGRPRKTQTKEK